jgi:hypothetical protein
MPLEVHIREGGPAWEVGKLASFARNPAQT